MANESRPNIDIVDEADFAEIAMLMRYLRDERKEALFVPVAKLQLAYLDQAAARSADNDPDRAKEIRRFARGVAFNIASFTWPGWGDWPEPISEARQQLGLIAAQRALELAKQVDDVKSNTWWMLGAHQLNSQYYDAAIESFEQAKKLAANDFYRSMHSAWQTLTNALMSPTSEKLADLDAAITALRTADRKDAEFFADQLQAARLVYLDDADEN